MFLKVDPNLTHCTSFQALFYDVTSLYWTQTIDILIVIAVRNVKHEAQKSESKTVVYIKEETM